MKNEETKREKTLKLNRKKEEKKEEKRGERSTNIKSQD